MKISYVILIMMWYDNYVRENNLPQPLNFPNIGEYDDNIK